LFWERESPNPKPQILRLNPKPPCTEKSVAVVAVVAVAVATVAVGAVAVAAVAAVAVAPLCGFQDFQHFLLLGVAIL
jgi:hypothetical protein